MSDALRCDFLADRHSRSSMDHPKELEEWEKLARQLEREVNDLRTDAARYRAVRGVCVGMKWSDTPFFYTGSGPEDEKYVIASVFDQMADRLCDDPQ